MYNHLINFYITANCAFFDNTNNINVNANTKPHYVEILNHHKIDISTEAGRKELREKAIEYLWSLRGKKVECPILEKEFGKPVFIEFRMRGLKKTSRFLANYKKVLAMFYIKNIIKTATSYAVEPNYKKEKKQQIEYYIHLFNKIKINKEIIKVNLSIEKQGNLFYYDMQLDKNSIIVLDSCKKNTNLNLMQAKQLLPSDQIGNHNVTNNFDDVNSFLNLFFEDEFCCK